MSVLTFYLDRVFDLVSFVCAVVIDEEYIAIRVQQALYDFLHCFIRTRGFCVHIEALLLPDEHTKDFRLCHIGTAS